MITLFDQIFKSRVFFWIRVAQFFIALGIFTFVALMPASLVHTQHSDKSLHFVGNLLLFLSAYVASGGRFKLWLLGLMLIPYSILIEASQWLTVTRHVDPKDAIANIGGLIVGCAIALLCDWVWKKIKPAE